MNEGLTPNVMEVDYDDGFDEAEWQATKRDVEHGLRRMARARGCRECDIGRSEVMDFRERSRADVLEALERRRRKLKG